MFRVANTGRLKALETGWFASFPTDGRIEHAIAFHELNMHNACPHGAGVTFCDSDPLTGVLVASVYGTPYVTGRQQASLAFDSTAGIAVLPCEMQVKTNPPL